MIYEETKKVGFKLFIMIIDACNTFEYYKKGPFPTDIVKRINEITPLPISLFNYKGNAYVISSEYGLASRINDNGSYLTQCLIKELYLENNWLKSFYNARKELFMDQKPYYEHELSTDGTVIVSNNFTF